jgi:hypothetical protein
MCSKGVRYVETTDILIAWRIQSINAAMVRTPQASLVCRGLQVAK